MPPRSTSASRKKKRITPPARATWAGDLRISLVVVPVNVFTGVNREAEMHFHQIHKSSGQRVRMQKTVPGIGPVEAEDIVKGYEYEKGRYLMIEPEELRALKLESSSAFTVVRFVDRNEIDALYFDEPLFVAPSEESGIEAFAVTREALRATRKVGLGQIVLSGRERIAALQPCGDGMLMETLRYADDIKRSGQFFEPIKGVKPPADQLALAKQLIEQKSGKFEPDQFQDHYEDAVRELVEAKLKGRKPPVAEPERKSAEIIDLMAALRQSVKGKAKADVPAPKPRKAARGR